MTDRHDTRTFEDKGIIVKKDMNLLEAFLEQILMTSYKQQGVPLEIIEAAKKVSNYFEEKGVKDWALLGVQNRKPESFDKVGFTSEDIAEVIAKCLVDSDWNKNALQPITATECLLRIEVRNISREITDFLVKKGHKDSSQKVNKK